MKTTRSILVATDLTGISDEIVRAAGALAALTDAKLHILHSLDFHDVPYAGEGLAHPTFQGRMHDAERVLDEQIRRSVRPSVEVASQEVVIHVAYKAILDRADAVHADLIVLGAHRKRPLGDAFLGSTVDRVIRSARAPCLVVRGPLSLPLRRVMVPLDLSEPALGALDVALEWSESLGPLGVGRDPGIELIVLHVIPQVFDFEAAPVNGAVIGPELRRAVGAARERIGAVSPIHVREEVHWDDSPAEEIVRMADAEKVDLVVLGTHGYGALKRALIGSVASGVARGASCPVLLVPPALWSTETA